MLPLAPIALAGLRRNQRAFETGGDPRLACAVAMRELATMGLAPMDRRPAAIARVADAPVLRWSPAGASAGNVTGQRVAAKLDNPPVRGTDSD